jgi:predicted nucleic acid-binding protein
MRALIDLNVVLDVLLDRSPWADDAAVLWARIEQGTATGLLSAHAITTLFYIAQRARDREFASRCLRDVLTVFEVAPVDHAVIDAALGIGLPDCEDAVTAAAAVAAGCELVVSRDPGGFRGGPLPVLDARSAVVFMLGAATQ